MDGWRLCALVVVSPSVLALVVSLAVLTGLDRGMSDARLRWSRRVTKSVLAIGVSVGFVFASLVIYWVVRFFVVMSHAD